MALQELVDYVQEALADPEEYLQRPPDVGEPARPPPPSWLEEVEYAERPPPTFGRGETPLVDLPENGFDGGTVRVSYPDRGPDALAYYRPFHFHSRLWGIFVWDRGLLHLASIGQVHVHNENRFAPNMIYAESRRRFVERHAGDIARIMVDAATNPAVRQVLLGGTRRS